MFLPIAVGAAVVGLALRSPREVRRVTMAGNYTLPAGTIISMGSCPRGYYQVGSVPVIGANGVTYQGSYCAPITYATIPGVYR